MTPAMVEKARRNAESVGLANVEFRDGLLEELPLDAPPPTSSSPTASSICPDKAAVFAEAYRVLKPGGRLQIADIVVSRAVPEDAKADVALWTG